MHILYLLSPYISLAQENKLMSLSEDVNVLRNVERQGHIHAQTINHLEKEIEELRKGNEGTIMFLNKDHIFKKNERDRERGEETKNKEKKERKIKL